MLNKLKIKHDDMALLSIRIGLGLIFLVHGYGKINGIAGTTEFFSSLGLSVFWVYIVSWTEFLGGIAVLLGVFSRCASFVLAITMIVAILLVKLQYGFGKSEFEIMLLLSSIAIMLAGPGQYNITSLFKAKS
jgi:putative oxidoreductase